jgi:peptide deformylase
MAILNLVVAPNPLLQRKSLPVTKITENTKKLAIDMLDTMYYNQGIGLSAVQVGVLERIIVIDVKWPDTDKSSNEQYIMINPEIIHISEKQNDYNEGCLSFPSESVNITRPTIITVKYLNLDGKEEEIEADGLFATCIQHEIDHLNGITISSYISPLKRTMMINRIKKIKKNMQHVV